MFIKSWLHFELNDFLLFLNFLEQLKDFHRYNSTDFEAITEFECFHKQSSLPSARLPPICENLPFLLNQAETNCKTNFYSSGFDCIGNQCICQNGLPETENCEVNLSENCYSCNTGYHLNNGSCNLTQCTCQNGLPDTENCETNLSENCASCNTGYYLNNFFGYLNNGICSPNQCTCQNGLPDTENCATNLYEVCQSCDAGFELVEQICVEELLSEEVNYDCSIPGPLINPAEANRSYSSVRSDNPFFADSAINSGVGWAAGTSEVGQWMMLDLGSDIPVQAMAIQSLNGNAAYRVDGYQLKYWTGAYFLEKPTG